MIHKAFLWLGFLTIISCQKEDRLEVTNLVTNQTFTEDLRVQGHEFDSLIIKDCVFNGATLNIGDADYVKVENCQFKNIKNNGIKVGFIGPANSIEISNCTFENIGYNAIDSHEDAEFGVIHHCVFKKVALSDVGAAMGQPHHAIYWKGKDVHIYSNVFEGDGQNFGNGISVRSSGTIEMNRITGYPKNGIMYYANHPGYDTLLIQNNYVWGNEYGITLASQGNESWHNANVIVRFNSVVCEKNRVLYVGQEFEGNTNIEVYGNILINPEGEYFKSFYDFDTAHYFMNLESKENIGFIDYNAGNLDLLPESIAQDYCAGMTNFPDIDIHGEPRESSTLNAGADE